MNMIERSWYHSSWKNWLLWPLLWPLSLLFRLVAAIRRFLFKIGLKSSYRLIKPVIVVGNITVGGNGKTPFVIWLVQLLKNHGIKAGVISRGYGGNSDIYPIAVDASLNTSQFGDEPVLIYQRCGCPVVVGPNRVESGEHLLANFDVDIVICDDGMQHYRLQRDIEVAIVDAERQFGNSKLMPLGPLREKISRLQQVDYVIYNGQNHQPQVQCDASFALTVGEAQFVMPGQQNMVTIENQNIYGVCAIGNSERFKRTLTAYAEQQQAQLAGFTAFADHHKFSLDDFKTNAQQWVFMTEKDAVKCVEFAQPLWCYLPVDATLNADFSQKLVQHISQILQKNDSR